MAALSFIVLPTQLFLIYFLAGLWKNIIYSCFGSSLRQIPAGHWTAHFSQIWFFYIRWSRRASEIETIHKLHQTYGPIIRLGPNKVSVNSEDVVRWMYGLPMEPSYATAFMFYRTLNMFAMTKRADHDHRRRLVSGAFKKSTLVSSDALCEILTRVLYGQLSPCIEDQSVHGRHIEVYDLSRAYAMDVFTNYQYGLQLGTRFIQDVEQRRWYFSRYAKVRPYLFQMSEIPGVAALVTRSGLAVISRSTHAALCELEAWNLALCDKAEALIIGDSIPCVPTENAEYPAIYAQIRAAIHQSYDIDPRPDQPTTAVRQAVASEMFDYNLGAHETSGNTLTSLLFELSRNPDIQEKLRQQLRTFLPPKGTVLTPINLKDLDSCPYLDAVILETLRFWPATPCGRPRLSPSACSLASHDLPAGVEIYHYPYSLHRNERVFPEPEVWNPERWILSSQDQLTRMRKSLFSFGGGYRMCIGNHFAMLSMKSFIAAVYTHYETTIAENGEMNLADGVISGPKGRRLCLVFRRV